jgi:hypothetical protein
MFDDWTMKGGQPKDRSKNGSRNREIFAAVEAGEERETVAARYGLRPATIETILRSEEHLRAVSIAPVYRALRGEDA